MKQQKQNLIKKSFHLLLKTSFVFMGLLLLKEDAYAVNLIRENFDSLTNGSVIDGQTCWTDNGSSGSGVISVIQNAKSHTSPNALKLENVSGGGTKINTKKCNFNTTDFSNSTINFSGAFYWYKGHAYANNGINFLIKKTNNINSERLFSITQETNGGSTIQLVGLNSSSLQTGISKNAWHTFVTTIIFNATNATSICVAIDGGSQNCITSGLSGFSSTDWKYFAFSLGNNNDDQIGIYLDSLNTDPFITDNTTTHIETITPTSSATTTTPIPVTLNYFIGDDLDKTTKPKIELYLTNFDTDSTPYKFYSSEVSTTTGGYTINTTIEENLIDGFWQISPQLTGTNITYFNQTPVKLGWFVIGTTKFDEDTLTKTTTEYLGKQETPYEKCSVTDLSGCFKNAFIFLFSPKEGIAERFKELKIEERSPFIYIYQIGTLRNEMFGATPSGITSIAVTVPNFGEITFLSKTMIDNVPYASTIKSILGFLIYIMMAEYIYIKVKNIFNKTS